MPPDTARDEIIVADDGSGPETLDMIRVSKRIFVGPLSTSGRKTEGFGPQGSETRLSTNPTGEYIILLDGDCIPSSHFVQDHLALAERKTFLQGKRILVGKEISDSFTIAHTEKTLKLIRYALSGGLSNSHHLIRLPCFPPFAIEIKAASEVAICPFFERIFLP